MTLPQPEATVLITSHGEARGTQSFVHIIGACWLRPSLLGLELLWRWAFGLPLLALLAWVGERIWIASLPALRATGIFDFSLEFPMQGALQIAEAYQVLRGPIIDALAWLLPVAVVAWAIAAGLGRNAVLRRYDRKLPWRPGTMIVLQLLRILALCGSFALWFALIHWAAGVSMGNPTAPSATGASAEPDLVLYCSLVIVFSLGVFTIWALLSWIFSIAPLLAVLENRSMAGSLIRSLRLGKLTGKLVEINLVMNIVKLALVVLAMVFSATPLPFQSVVQGASLYAWWGVVTLLYLLASDFFQVARVAAYVELWRAAAQAEAAPTQSRQQTQLQNS
jgi:hypothetical protein